MSCWYWDDLFVQCCCNISGMFQYACHQSYAFSWIVQVQRCSKYTRAGFQRVLTRQSPRLKNNLAKKSSSLFIDDHESLVCTGKSFIILLNIYFFFGVSINQPLLRVAQLRVSSENFNSFTYHSAQRIII